MSTPPRKPNSKTPPGKAEPNKRKIPPAFGLTINAEECGLIIHSLASRDDDLRRAIISVQGSRQRVKAICDVTITRVAGKGEAVPLRQGTKGDRTDTLTVRAGTTVCFKVKDYAVFEAIEVRPGAQNVRSAALDAQGVANGDGEGSGKAKTAAAAMAPGKEKVGPPGKDKCGPPYPPVAPVA